jgi:AraC-like DNA-binding protein
MALLSVLAGDRALEHRLTEALEPRHSLALGHSWGGVIRLIRERPTTGAIVDLDAVTPLPSTEGALANLRAQFPHLGLVLLVRRYRDPFRLFRLGRAGIQNLILLRLDDLESELKRALARAAEGGATALVTRSLSQYLPKRERRLAFLAMDSVHRRWTAEELAEEMALTRPFISERMKGFGLPSLGHFLLWTRLFHAGHWLEDPGRTGESIGRQLEYSSGAAFRRALKHYTGATPTQVRENGGLHLVFRNFLRQTNLPAPRPTSRVTLV